MDEEVKKVLLLLAGVCLFIIVLGFFGNNPTGQRVLTNLTTTPEPKTQQMKIGEKELAVLIAKTDEERKKGLSGMKDLDQIDGMLFVFDQQDIQTPFWMKDMEMSIDIIWINDQRVIQIEKDVQPPEKGTKEKDLKLYTANQPFDQVLETKANFTTENKIKVGDQVELPETP